ncbi:MAG: UvrD-helicase domain-containing protein [Candidatus Paracaedibacteraceae bacterium]|nr:UvrD-helicase domain-containing protein [Candidatus Paracaedibacteraceae bacterium]
MSPFKDNPSYPQKLAASPQVSAWVSASAGTGKTKVLTDRILNLMLNGEDPSKILCLTFTKAAAAEMQTRLFQRLSAWVQMDDAQLHQTLEDLWQGPVTPILHHKARSLFTQILDLSGGIKIQTIHGFCQTVLGRFPLEARIPAQFSILDDMTASALLRRASAKMLHQKSQEYPDLFALLALHYKDKKFEETLEDLLSHRRHLRQLSHHNIDSYSQHLKTILAIPSNISLLDYQARESLITNASQEGIYDRAGLLACLNVKANPILEQWLASSGEERVKLYDQYARLFLTADGAISKRPAVKHDGEAERIYRLNGTLNRLEIAQKSLVLFVLGTAIYDHYQQQKLAESTLDYDDLIEKTINLLNDPELAAWVLYKLDGGIDHILIDEAQDTNPAQWDVIKALMQDFFRPDKSNRTLFVVGDSKQSIYSFQGADPHDFVQLEQFFAQQSQAIGQPWRSVDLSVSFRSTPEILTLVDSVFADKTLQEQVLAESNLVHTPFRQDHQGKVCLWPSLVKSEPEEKDDHPGWTLPIDRTPDTGLHQQCAQQIAQQIDHLLYSGMVLPSTQQPIQAKDILILVRQRSDFINHLIRSLKQRHIPIAGADRFLLTSHLAVKDLLSLGQFLLQPLDDLSLATVLTSPLIGLSHADLMTLSINRQGSLWMELIKHAESPIYKPAYEWLKEALDKTDYLSPFELFSHILHKLDGKKRILSRLSHEAEDVLGEFLNLLLTLEHQLIPTLELVMGEILAQGYELKRDSADTQHNEVRIMTIHGSKGLQAPVVILVEKFNAKSPPTNILWHHTEQQCNLLLVSPPKAQDIDFTTTLKANHLFNETAEDKRLLYVALTRAQDHLYLCGYGDKLPQDSWYNLLENKGVAPEEWIPAAPLPLQDSPMAASLWSPVLPDFLCTTIDLSHRLKPIEEKELTTAQAHRGILIHKLLEVLPDIHPSLWQEKGLQIIQSLTSDRALQQDCLATTLTLLQTDNLQEFFGQDSVAELEVMTANGDLIRLDRIVLGSTIKILDYKSSQTPPLSAIHISQSIRQQLEGYKEALASLYPTTPINCYVLWTTNGRLDPL